MDKWVWYSEKDLKKWAVSSLLAVAVQSPQHYIVPTLKKARLELDTQKQGQILSWCKSV